MAYNIFFEFSVESDEHKSGSKTELIIVVNIGFYLYFCSVSDPMDTGFVGMLYHDLFKCCKFCFW